MSSDNLPNGWEIKKFGDVFKLKSGSALTAKKMIKGQYPVFGGNGIAGYHNDFNEEMEVIIGRVGALCGNVRLINQKFWLTDNAFKISSGLESFDDDFVVYMLNYQNLRSFARQSAQPVISNSSLKDVKLYYPKKIEEQKQIVTILDKAFTAIDTAKTNAEQNLQNAKELFESYLQNIFENKGDDWEEKTFGEICDFVRGPFGGSLKKSCFVDEGYAVYEQQHAIYNQFTKIRYFIDEKKFIDMQRFELKSNDLIMSCSGTMGKVAIVPDNIQQGIINQALLKLTPKKMLSNQYLKCWMTSLDFDTKIKSYTVGATIKNVASVKLLKQIKVPLPPLAEQKEIVKKLDTLQAETKKLENIYTQKIADLEELKKSILQKAFSGQLKLEND